MLAPQGLLDRQLSISQLFVVLTTTYLYRTIVLWTIRERWLECLMVNLDRIQWRGKLTYFSKIGVISLFRQDLQ